MKIILLLAAMTLSAGAIQAADETAGAAATPVNQWVKLETAPGTGYIWSAPVWVPARGQLLHWGGQESGKPSRNDVRAFDASLATPEDSFVVMDGEPLPLVQRTLVIETGDTRIARPAAESAP